MADVILSETLRDLRGALPLTAAGTVIMSPHSACDFLAALDILTDQARKLEAEVDQLRWRLGAARDAGRNQATVGDAVDEAVQRLVARRARIERRESDLLTGRIEAAQRQIDAVREGLVAGNVAVFPVAPRPRPTSDPCGVDIEAAMWAIAGALRADPLGRDGAEDGA